MPKYYKKYAAPVARYVTNSAYQYARKYAPPGTAKAVGAAAGAATGLPYAKYVGAQVGKQFSNITGVGAYYKSTPKRTYTKSTSIMNPRTATPRVKNADDDVYISKCEYLMDIRSGPTGTPTEFNQQVMYLNPGLDTDEGGLFTFLPALAQNFTQYSFEQCVIEYRPISGNATGSNTTLGSVIMCANYIPSSDPCENKLQALNSQYAVSTAPSKGVFFPIECKKSQQNLRMHQIRNGELKANQNIDLFDYAMIEVDTQGCQVPDIVLGELWITYRVRLSKFKFTKTICPVVTEPLFAKFRYSGAAADWSTNPLGPSSGTVLALTDTTSNFTPVLNRTARTITIPSTVVSKHFWLYCKYRSVSPQLWATFGITCSGNTSPLVSLFSVGAGQTDVVTAGSGSDEDEFCVSILISVSSGGGGTCTFTTTGSLDDVTDVEIGLIEQPFDAFTAGA